MSININGQVLDEDAISGEIQYHPAEDLETARDEAAKALVIRTLLLQQARAEGYGQEDDDAIEALLEKHIAVEDPDEAECRVCYEKSGEYYRAPDLFEASHILIPAQPEDADQRKEAKAKAEACISTLQDKPDQFAKLAKEFSACDSAGKGGSLGQFSTGETVDEFETFLYNLEPGQLCPVPVYTRFGYHVLRLDHREFGKKLPFEAARETVRDDILSHDWREAASAYIQQLVKKAKISGINMSNDEG